MTEIEEKVEEILEYAGHYDNKKTIAAILSLIAEEVEEIINTPIVDEDGNELKDHIHDAYLRQLQRKLAKEKGVGRSL